MAMQTPSYGAVPTFDAIKVTQRYKSRRQAMINEYNSFEPIHRDLRDFIGPRTARFTGEQVNKGNRQDDKIINTSARLALRVLAGGMQQGVTNPLRPWFKLAAPDPAMNDMPEVKIWLAEVERIMLGIFAKSNFYNVMKSSYSTLALYGTAAISIEDDEEDVIRLKHIPTGSYWIANDARGRVHALIRDFKITAEQAMQDYGEKASDAMKAAYEQGNYDQWFDVIQVIEPNSYRRQNSPMSRDKKFMSLHIDPSAGPGKDGILKFSGFDQFPVLVPRWDVLGEDIYGTGCGELVLGDNKQMQLMEKRKLQGIDQNARPTMLADASMRTQRTSNNPGETVYVNGLMSGKPGYQRAYEQNPYINELREEIRVVIERINEGFFKNLFLMITELGDQPNITATQINMLREEKLMMLGPVLERLDDEALDPAIDITFTKAQQRGMFPEPPEILQGKPLKIEYISVIAQAQKAIGVTAVERFVGFVGNTAALYPDALAKLDINKTIDFYADGVGIPPTLVRSDDAVKEASAARQQNEQLAQAADAAVPITQAAKNLATSPTGGENALAALLR